MLEKVAHIGHWNVAPNGRFEGRHYARRQCTMQKAVPETPATSGRDLQVTARNTNANDCGVIAMRWARTVMVTLPGSTDVITTCSTLFRRSNFFDVPMLPWRFVP